MERRPIEPNHFVARPCGLFDAQWLLLTCGDFAARDFNCMTISWGSLGTMWGVPFAQVVVRPQRYTFQFMEKYSTFTVCAFPERYRPALALLGSKSGREGDKLAEAGLTPAPATVVAAPGYAEAELVIECQKIYWSDFDPAHFVDRAIDPHYPAGDYHRSYFGQIAAVTGDAEYLAS